MLLKKIPIKNGNELEVQLTEEFLKHVRRSMLIPADQNVTDDQIVNFIHQAFKDALDKVPANGS